MNATCPCGMTLELEPDACHECGTTCCRSCALEVDSGIYCRWCTTGLALRAA